jgi:hypothetical protein
VTETNVQKQFISEAVSSGIFCFQAIPFTGPPISVTGFDEILPFGKKMKTLLVYLPIFNIFLEIKYSRRKFFPRSCLYVAQNLGIFGTFLSFSKTFLVSLHIGFFLLEQLLSQICCRFI